MRFGQFRQFHENPTVIRWWQTLTGRWLDWLTPARRRLILALGAIWVGFEQPLQDLSHLHGRAPLPGTAGTLLVIALVFALTLACYRAAQHFAAMPALVRRHPLLTLHALYWGFVVLLWQMPVNESWYPVLIGIAAVLPFLLWRLSYLLLSAHYGRVAGTRFTDHLLYFWPAFGGSNTPYGKGLDYLSRTEAQNSQELARSQLAGLKLLLLSGIWSLGRSLMEALVYGPGTALTAALGGHTLAIPRLSELIHQPATSPGWQAWASLYCELIWQVLKHATLGHSVVATLRLFGFNVFRNTYKPLLAESIVEFWNRYFYYFKELLVNFFFLPVFAQTGKPLRNWPKLRLFAALFAAAFIGNSYYHLLTYNLVLGLQLPWSRLFYCLLLAAGIYLSMLRAQRPGGHAHGPFRRVLRIAGVWTFFAIIYIWNVRTADSFETRLRFFLSLFGVA